MRSDETVLAERGPAPTPTSGDFASLEKGLDALESDRSDRQPRWRRLLAKFGPPIVAVVVVLLVWALIGYALLVSAVKKRRMLDPSQPGRVALSPV